MLTPEIMVLPDVAAIAQEAADRIVAAAQEAIELRGTFTIALAGGSTPKALYQLLSAEPLKSQIDWIRTEVFFGDERCVPPDHAESNYKMASDALLSKVPIPGDNIYRMKGELEPEKAGKAYEAMLNDRFGPSGLDVILLGIGEDGHTASLFPGMSALAEREKCAVAHYVEKSTTGKSWRITLTAPFINRAERVIFMVAGEGKAKVLREILEGPREPDRLPAQLVDPNQTRVTWLLDAGAAGMNEEDEGVEIEL